MDKRRGREKGKEGRKEGGTGNSREKQMLKKMARKEWYLYMQSTELLLCLNLSELCESGSSSRPDFEVAHDYSDGRVPIGMGCMIVGSKIYMVGGENTKEGSMILERDEKNWLNSEVFQGPPLLYVINAVVAYDLDTGGQLNAHWVLDELSELFQGPPLLYPSQGFLTDLGGGRMCLLFNGLQGIRWTILVEVFHVSITTVGDRPVDRRGSLHSYDLGSWEDYDALIYSGFVCDHSNESDIEADASFGLYSMSDVEHLVIFHYDGEFEFELNRPQYKGGRQKMRYLSGSVTFNELCKVALEASNWAITSDQITIKYLLHNGNFFSMIDIDDDNDINGLLKSSISGAKGILLFVSRRLSDEGTFQHNHGNRSAQDERIESIREAPSIGKPDIKLKAVLPPSPPPLKDFRTIDIQEDDDTRFPQTLSYFADDDESMFEEVNVELLDVNVSESVRSGPATNVDVNGSSAAAQLINSGVEIDTTSFNEEDGFSKSPFVDTMIPEDVVPEEGTSVAREMWLGREFPDREAFRRAIAKYAIYNNFTLKHERTNMKMVTASCKGVDCPWRIHASMVDSGPHFRVRKYNSTHCCSKPLMGTAHRQATAKLIAEFIEEKVRCNNDLRPKDIINECQIEFGTRITYRRAHMAKELALSKVRGSYEESFMILPLYCDELHRTNPGSYTALDIRSDDRFRRFFWSFGPCLRSFQTSLRPLIAVDGSHLRGKYPGVLMVAVTHDGNHQLFPIAFAFAEAELRDSWEWFLAHLNLSLGEPKNLTIISDRQKGLIPAVQSMMPSAKHCFCCHHIAENIKVAFNDHGIIRKFWSAARAYRSCEYDACMDHIKSVDERAYNYIHAIGRQFWATAFAHGRRYDMLTSNAAECTNSLLKDTRVLPITKQVEEIRAKLMEFFHRRSTQVQRITSVLTPYAEKYLATEMEESRRLMVRVAALNEYQVQSAEYVDIVNLDRRSCSCRKWDVIGIPCCHAVAAMKSRNMNPYDYCEQWYLTSTYQKTYSDVIHATRDRKQWEQHILIGRVLPPLATKQPGRPKKSRIRVEDRHRQRRVVTCSCCGERGHNRGSCKNPPVKQKR